MVSERDKKVLVASIWGVAGFFAFLAINLSLDGRVPAVVRLALGFWVMRLFYYPMREAEERGSFAAWAGQNTLYALIFVILYALFQYAWRLFYSGD